MCPNSAGDSPWTELKTPDSRLSDAVSGSTTAETSRSLANRGIDSTALSASSPHMSSSNTGNRIGTHSSANPRVAIATRSSNPALCRPSSLTTTARGIPRSAAVCHTAAVPGSSPTVAGITAITASQANVATVIPAMLSWSACASAGMSTTRPPTVRLSSNECDAAPGPMIDTHGDQCPSVAAARRNACETVGDSTSPPKIAIDTQHGPNLRHQGAHHPPGHMCTQRSPGLSLGSHRRGAD